MTALESAKVFVDSSKTLKKTKGIQDSVNKGDIGVDDHATLSVSIAGIAKFIDDVTIKTKKLVKLPYIEVLTNSYNAVKAGLHKRVAESLGYMSGAIGNVASIRVLQTVATRAATVEILQVTSTVAPAAGSAAPIVAVVGGAASVIIPYSQDIWKTKSALKSVLEPAAKIEVYSMNVLARQLGTQSPPVAIKSPKTNNAPALDNHPYDPSYTIKVNKGENLSEIALREKGDPKQYKEIAEKNHIGNPDLIHPTKKKELVIPGYQKSNEEKATVTVEARQTLELIGKRTGHTAQEIFELNKAVLKNDPNRIYPGQELLIPENHAALINHPAVQARIRENLAKHLLAAQTGTVQSDAVTLQATK